MLNRIDSSPHRSKSDDGRDSTNQRINHSAGQDSIKVLMGGSNQNDIFGLLDHLSEEILFKSESTQKSKAHSFDSSSLDTNNQSKINISQDYLDGHRLLCKGVNYSWLDTPGRKYQFSYAASDQSATNHWLELAPESDIAIIVVDVNIGIQERDKQQIFHASLLCVPRLILAVSMEDATINGTSLFEKISDEFKQYCAQLVFKVAIAVPVSIRSTNKSHDDKLPVSSHQGSSIVNQLQSITVSTRGAEALLISVLYIQKDCDNNDLVHADVLCGTIRLGEQLRITATGETAEVIKIFRKEKETKQAFSSESITLIIKNNPKINTGDVITAAQLPAETTDQFEADIVWLGEESGLTGRQYKIKLCGQTSSASITNLKYRINIDTLKNEAINYLSLNDSASCNLSMTQALAYKPYKQSKELGRFILSDTITNETVAFGILKHSLRRAQNVHTQTLSITRTDRERLNGHKGKVIWFTGLSGSGKSTIANALDRQLNELGLHTYILDGDNIRLGLNKDLGFTDADRVENIRRVAEVAKLMMDAGLIVMTSFISPFEREREMAKQLIGEENFIEVYVSTSLEECERRDVKGLYKKAREGKLPNMTGVGSPYERPQKPSLEVGGLNSSISNCSNKIIEFLKKNNYF